MAHDLQTLIRDKTKSGQWEVANLGHSYEFRHRIGGNKIRTSITPSDINAIHRMAADLEAVELEYKHMYQGKAKVTKRDNRVTVYFHPVEARKICAAVGKDCNDPNLHVRFHHNITAKSATITFDSEGSRKFTVNRSSEGPTLWVTFSGLDFPGEASFEDAPYVIEGKRIKMQFPEWKEDVSHLRRQKPELRPHELPKAEAPPMTATIGDTLTAEQKARLQATTAPQTTTPQPAAPQPEPVEAVTTPHQKRIDDLRAAVQLVNEYRAALREQGYQVTLKFDEQGTLTGKVSILVSEEL